VINTDPDYVDKDDSIHMKFGWCAGSADGCRSRVVGWMRRPGRPWLPGEWGHLFHRGMLGDHRAGGAARLTLVNVVIKV
jgi:hypothetical protein